MSMTRQPGSVRDIREGGFVIDKPEMLTAPAWLNKAARKEFKSMVVALAAAEVPIKQIDSYSIAMAAQCISSIAAWSEREEKAETLARPA